MILFSDNIKFYEAVLYNTPKMKALYIPTKWGLGRIQEVYDGENWMYSIR